MEFSSGQAIYAQDDPADCVFYIVKGRVKLAVVSASGKEAVVAILEDGHFFGQASLLTGEPVRLTTAIPLVATAVARFDRQEMTQRMHADGEFADAFISYLVAHSGRIEADLVDHLLNSTEKRLARVLLLLANFGKSEALHSGAIPKLSQETLAHMVGASRARVSSFLNKFRKAGFIEYNVEYHGGIRVHNSLLKVILRD